MEEKYSTLRVIFDLVKGSRYPTQFACKASEIIIHHNQPWDTILFHLDELANEGSILFIVPSVLTITEKGITKIDALLTSAPDEQFVFSKEVA